MKVIILGGTGFVGRHLVRYLVNLDMIEMIRVCDKNPPEISWLNEDDTILYKHQSVNYMMSNLFNPSSVAKVFNLDGSQFDIVINLASTADYGKENEIYEERVIGVARVCGEEAKRRGIKKWIEVSTGQVYKSSSSSSKENDKLKPWTAVAASKLKAEQILVEMGLPLIIIRPSTIYGPGDIFGIMPRLVCGAVYKKLNEEMQFLWSDDLQINTVHVRDVAKAIWFLAEKGTIGEVYNLSDLGKTTQMKINMIISQIFNIKTSCLGSFKSAFARLNFQNVVESVNEKHMQPWGDLMTEYNITLSPLTPYLEPELLYNNDLALDGSKITKLGFVYDFTEITVDLILESLRYWISINAFPALI